MYSLDVISIIESKFIIEYENEPQAFKKVEISKKIHRFRRHLKI